MTDEVQEIQEEPKKKLTKTDTIIKGFDAMTEKLADFEVRLVNMANKLEEHLHTPDAHNPGTMNRKR